MEPIQYRLDNGMKVLLLPTSTAPVVACNVWVGVGSADEEPHEAGLAHVHEHMLFKGTEDRGVGVIARDVESAGGHINAFTSFDQTCYYIVLSSRYFDSALDILSDAIRRSSFDEDELSRELEVIQEEIKRGEDNPGRVVSKMIFETAFQEHPYRLPIIGTKESVDSFTRDHVVSFFHKHYVPENMTVVLVGDFDEADARAKVNHYFGDFQGAHAELPPRPVEPAQTATRAAVQQKEIRQNHLRVAFHIPAVRHEDIPALDLLSIILGYGDASHLDRTIQREAQLVTSIFATAYTPKEPGLFLLGADFQVDPDRPETAPAAVLQRILEETFRFRHVKPGAVDLERGRTLLESQAIYSKQTIEGLAMKLGHYQMVAGDPAFEALYYEALRQLTPADIRRVARTYLTAENATAVLLHPVDEDAVDQADLVAAVQTASDTADSEAVTKIPAVNGDGFVRIPIPDGPILIVQEDPSVETFSMRAMSLGGLRYESSETAGVHKLLSQLITSGTPRRSALEIAGEVESMAASIGGIAGRNSFGLAMTGLTRTFEQCFDVFADCALASNLPEDEIRRELRVQSEQIRSRQDQLGSVSYEQFAAAFFKGHPYELPLLGDERTLRNLDRDRLLTYLSPLQDPTRMVLAVVGKVDVEEVVNHVERLFVRPHATSEGPRSVAAPPFPTEPSLVVGDLEKEQAHVIVGFPGPTLKEDKNYAMDLVYAVLSGQGGRLFYELRDRQSLAYSVFASMVSGLETSSFTIRIGTSPEKIAQAIEGIRVEVQKLRDGSLTEEEIERARRYLIGNHDIGLQRSSSRAMSFALDELYGLGFKRSLAYGDTIAEITLDDVHAAIDTYLNPDHMLVSVIKPPSITVDADALGLTILA